MAIDTAAKRRSACDVQPMPGNAGVTPDATPDAAWRQQAGWGYSGIAAAAPGGGVAGGVFASPVFSSRVIRVVGAGRG